MLDQFLPVVVSPVELDAELLDRAILLKTGVAVLPVYQSEGKGVYSEPSVMLVKQLRALGADAEYLDPSDARVFEVKKGDLGGAVLSFVLGIASSAAWDAVKAWLARHRRNRLSVTYIELEEIDGRRGKAWQVGGDVGDVLKAIDRLRDIPRYPEANRPEAPDLGE